MWQKLTIESKNSIEEKIYNLQEKKAKLVNDMLSTNEVFLKMKFKQMQGFPLDLKNPKTLNAKMQWLKLNDLTDLHKQCADKYTVRSFVEKEVGKEYLVPLLYITDNPKNLTYGNLPKKEHFIIKTTHDSSGGVIVRNLEKDIPDIKALQEKFTKLLKSKHYRGGRENQYKDIKPRIVVEQLLEDKNGKKLTGYATDGNGKKYFYEGK